MARRAEAAGLPPELPVMAALVESNLQNLDHGDAVLRGLLPDAHDLLGLGQVRRLPEGPGKQIQWFIDHAEPLKARFGSLPRRRELSAPGSPTRRRPAAQYRYRYALRFEEARALLERGRAGAGAPDSADAPSPGTGHSSARRRGDRRRSGSRRTHRRRARAAPGRPPRPAAPAPTASSRSPSPRRRRPPPRPHGPARGAFLAIKPAGPPSAVASVADVPPAASDPAAAGAGRLGACRPAGRQARAGGRGRRSANTGVEVDEYLAAAGVPPGNPWCASFVTWALQQAGHRIPGSGWAAVRTWVQAAEAGTSDLQVVSPGDARPGDIVAYDWGGQEDFGADGHIGFVACRVEGGRFTALEGNAQDAVMEVPRQVGGGGANVEVPAHRGGRPAQRRAGAVGCPGRPGGGEPAGPPPRPPRSPPPATGGAPATPATARPRRQIAAWMARLAERRGLPRELPVMAGLVESGLRNLSYGDADSVGFFQMRLSIWDRGTYAGSAAGPSCRSSGSSTRPRRSSASASPAACRSTTRTSSGSGSPTSSARPPSTAAATSCGSRRRATSCARRARRRRRSRRVPAAAVPGRRDALAARPPGPRPPPPAGDAGGARAEARWPRRRSTSARPTSGAARPRRPASTARA